MIIPAADNMGLREEGERIVIPLARNINDKSCLFAGSIGAGATLCAYRSAERLFASRALSGDIVAKAASIDYLKRIESDGFAAVEACGEPVCKPNGNYVLSLTGGVSDAAGTRCAALTAELVLLKTRAASAGSLKV